MNAAERAALTSAAVAMRIEGHSHRAIAARLGWSSTAVYRAIRKVLDADPVEDVNLLRIIEAQRLDALLRAVWPHASSGHVPSVLAAVRVSEARQRLYGLDSPAEDGPTAYVIPADLLPASADDPLPPVDQLRQLPGPEPVEVPPLARFVAQPAPTSWEPPAGWDPPGRPGSSS